MINKGRGFTLIELLIVIIIVGILAAIAIPMIRNFVARAITTEAITALGSLLTQEKLYYAEHGYYATNIDDLVSPRIGGSYGTCDLDGTYFSLECYGILKEPGGTIVLMCFPDPENSLSGLPPNIAPQADKAKGLSSDGSFLFAYINMDENGNIYSNIAGLGYPHYW